VINIWISGLDKTIALPNWVAIFSSLEGMRTQRGGWRMNSLPAWLFELESQSLSLPGLDCGSSNSDWNLHYGISSFQAFRWHHGFLRSQIADCRPWNFPVSITVWSNSLQ
jgi:hypothetical protein